MSSSLLQGLVKLGNLLGTSNYALYWIHRVACSDSVSHNQVQVLSIPVLWLACRHWFPKLLRRQSSGSCRFNPDCRQVTSNTGILNSYTRLWLTELEQANPVDSIKDVVRSSIKVPKFNKYLKKAGGHIGRNVVEITIKMKTIVRKALMIKIIKLCLRNLDNYNEY